LTTIRLF